MAIVNNHDIAGIYARINRFIEELIKSVSSGTSQVNSFDQTRLATYLDAITVYHDWVVAQPQLDLPETHPRPIELPVAPAMPTVENESINDVVRMLAIARDELTNSQSARDAASLNKFDSSRVISVVNKVREFLTSYVVTTTPLDLPESSPAANESGPGRKGI